jgi:hypothetical protein
MKKPNIGKLTGGAILLAVSIWMLVFLEDPMGRYLGGSVVGILALGTIARTFFKDQEPL